MSSPFAIAQLTEGKSLADWRPSNRPAPVKAPAGAEIRAITAALDEQPSTAIEALEAL